MRTRQTRRRMAAVAAAVSMFALTACTSQAPHEAMCAYVIADGIGEARKIKDIIRPGEKEYTVDDQTRYVPCNARNYAFVPDGVQGDSTRPVVFKTKGENGVPGVEMRAYVTAYFQLNQNEEAMRAFLPFCQKYACATSSDETSGDKNFASAGWVGSLNEGIQPATLRAASDVGPNFGLDVVETSQWGKFGDAMSAVLNDKLRSITGAQHDFYCGTFSIDESGKEVCTPVRFSVDRIEPTDPAVRDSLAARARIVSDQARVEAERALGEKQNEAARIKYGTEADRVLADLARIQACKDAGASCTMVFGSGAAVAVGPR